jgi:hypothetical protein
MGRDLKIRIQSDPEVSKTVVRRFQWRDQAHVSIRGVILPSVGCLELNQRVSVK